MPRSRSRSRDRSRSHRDDRVRRSSHRDERDHDRSRSRRSRSRRHRDDRDRGRDRDRDRRRRRRRSPSSSSSSSSSSDDEGKNKAAPDTSPTVPGAALWKPPVPPGAPVGGTTNLAAFGNPPILHNNNMANITNMAMLLGGQGLAPGLGIPGLGGAMMSPIQDKKQRELYVGNLLTGHVTDIMLAQCFTEMFKGVPGFDPSKGPAVRNVQLSGNNFGFVEFRDGETTATAMKFAGAQLLGRPMKIGRPSGYMPPPVPVQGLEVPQELLTRLGCHQTFQLMPHNGGGGGGGGGMDMGMPMGVGGPRIDPKKQREVWVGNLSKEEVSNEMIKQLFEAMLLGQPNTPPNPVVNVQVGSNGMYAFVELATPELATICIQVFNGIEFKGRAMKVGRPTGYVDPAQVQGGMYGQPPPPPAPMTSLAALGVTPNASAGGSAGAPPLPPGNPTTKMICLENLVSIDELKDDEEYAAIVEDINTECAKSGTVVRCEVPRPGVEGVDAAMVGKAFVAFDSEAAATAAIASLNGRKFGPNTVRATFVTDSEFPGASGAGAAATASAAEQSAP